MKEYNYNNHILTQEEKVNLIAISNEQIQEFSKIIDGMYGVLYNSKHSDSEPHNTIMQISGDLSLFVCYALNDCSVLLKHLIQASSRYEKTFFRGKLQVQLNEGFKKLYGFNKAQQNKSEWKKLENIMQYFPGFQKEYSDITADLDELSKHGSWWQDERKAEVHIDMKEIYKYRHEEINESKIVMESMRLLDIFCKINDFMDRKGKAYTHYLVNIIPHKI